MTSPIQTWSSYQSAGKGTLGGGKSIMYGENLEYTDDTELFSHCASSTAQEMAFSAPGSFVTMGGVGMEGIVSPFEMPSSTTSRLPTWKRDGTAQCHPIYSNQMDGPVKQYIQPGIFGAYLDAFTRNGESIYKGGTATSTNQYDGVILFNGSAATNQNAINNKAAGNEKQLSAARRPMALRGPLMLHSWGYDLQGKPIPNTDDGKANAIAGTFKGDHEGRSDAFLDDWLTNRQTWPVAPVDLRFDRDRKVWTVPSRYRMIEATASGDIAAGANGVAKVIDSSLQPIFGGDGSELLNTKTIDINNPSWMPSLPDGQPFYAVFDTYLCKYRPILAESLGLSAFNTGCLVDCFGTGDHATGCITGLSPTIAAGRHLIAGTLKTPCPGNDTRGLLLDAVIPVSNKDYTPEFGPITCSDLWEEMVFEPTRFTLFSGTGEFGCQYVYVSGADLYKDVAACAPANPAYADCTDIECLGFGTGLTIINDVVHSRLKIKDTGSQEGSLETLVISTGLTLKNLGNCAWEITASGSGGACAPGIKTFNYVHDICCSGSGISVHYGRAVFKDGCFSGVVASGCPGDDDDGSP